MTLKQFHSCNFFLFQTHMHMPILSLRLRYKQFCKIKQSVSNKGDLIYTAHKRMFKTYYKLKKSLFYLDKMGISSSNQENEIEK